MCNAYKQHIEQVEINANDMKAMSLSSVEPFQMAASTPQFSNTPIKQSSINEITSQNSESLAKMIEGDPRSLNLLKTSYSRMDMTWPNIFRPGGAADFDADPIIRNINPRNIVAIYFAFLLEHKIAVISSKLTALTCLGEFLKEAIAPIRWNHVYVPILPKKMSAQILECPTPFFVGIQRDFFEARSVPTDVCILDLDHDACRMSSDLMKALKAGRRLIKAVDYVTRQSYTMCDGIFPNAFYESAVGASLGGKDNLSPSLAVLRLLKSFSSELVLGIKECGMHCVDHEELVVLFDEAMFLSFKRRRSPYSLVCSEDSFLQQFMRTQGFSVAVTSVVLRKVSPESRPPSRASSPFVSIRNKTPQNTALHVNAAPNEV